MPHCQLLSFDHSCLSTAPAGWMIPLFKTVFLTHIIAKTLFIYEVLYLLLRIGLSCLAHGGMVVGARPSSLQFCWHGLSCSPPVLFSLCVTTHRDHWALLLWGAVLWAWAVLGYESWFFQSQSLLVNSIQWDERTPLLSLKDMSHTQLYYTLCALDAALAPWQWNCQCSSDKGPHTEGSQELWRDYKKLKYF